MFPFPPSHCSVTSLWREMRIPQSWAFESFARNVMLILMVSSSSMASSSLPSIPTRVIFVCLLNVLHLAQCPTPCSFLIGLLISKFTIHVFLHMLDTCSFFFVNPKTSFTQLSGECSALMRWIFIALGPRVSSCAHTFKAPPVIPCLCSPMLCFICSNRQFILSRIAACIALY